MLLKGNKYNDGDDDTKVNLLNTLKVWVMGKGIGAINYASFSISLDGDEIISCSLSKISALLRVSWVDSACYKPLLLWLNNHRKLVLKQVTP